KGPLTALVTAIHLSGTGGAVDGQVTLDTSVPGWHGRGAVDVARIDLAKWLNRRDRPSDITGHVSFDLDFDLGRHFPRGTFVYNGSHAGFMEYAADNVTARGHITPHDVLVDAADGVAYGARVSARGSTIGIDEPFRFRFIGAARDVDLRRVPKSIPVPHV